MTEKKKKRGQRGADKKPRKHGGGMPRKAESEKAKKYTCTLYAVERDKAIELFGKLGDAVRFAIDNK